jgi:hypothetical protein
MTCENHPLAARLAVCPHIAIAATQSSGRVFLQAIVYQTRSTRPSPRDALPLCLQCAQQLGLPLEPHTLEDHQWYQKLSLQPVCEPCFRLWLEQPRFPVSECLHSEVNVDFHHPHGEFPNVSLRDVVNTPRSLGRPYLQVSRPRCADCGQALSREQMQSRLQTGGEFADERLRWSSTQ